MSSAILRIVRYSVPWSWSWVLNDERRSVLADTRLNPMLSGHQMLLEREALTSHIRGSELREAMTAELRALLTEELADALERSTARTLLVVGPRQCQIALSLPFELLFGREDPGTVVVRGVTPPSQQTPAPRASTERILTAFALTPDQAYLPLHLEADLIATQARSADIALDELFVSFTGEDLLAAARGASIVHLAAHGARGAMRCERRVGSPPMLTATDLISAWRDGSPRLVVLGFCESSSERDELRSTRVAASGEIPIGEFVEHLAPTALAPSSSMAFDLAAALPTAAIGLRANADDTEARRFLGSFYDAHLERGLNVEQAFAEALRESGFFDGVGLPIPVLYVGGDGGALTETVAADRPRGSVRCLPRDQRRCLNVFYEATSPLGRSIGGNWGWSVRGENALLLSTLSESLLGTAETWRAIQGVAGPSPILGFREVRSGSIEIVNRPALRPETALSTFRLDLNRWPHSVTIGELLAMRAAAPADSIALLATATCDVPAIVDAVLATGVDAIAAALRERVEGRTPSAWELARELLDLLPPELGAPIREWADGRWRRVEWAGQAAIDVIAAIATVPEDEHLLEPDQPMLYLLCERTGVSSEEQRAALAPLAQAGIISYGTGAVEGDLATNIRCDLLTAQRGWDARSPGAASALAECMVERELTLLPALDFTADLATPRLGWLAALCAECAHPRLEALLDELERREDGREVALSLRARSAEEAGPETRQLKRANEDTRWGAWDRLVQEARFEEAAALLTEIEATGLPTDHPSRFEANRLITRVADPNQGDLLQDALELESRLAEAPPQDRTAVEIELLLIVREAASSALQKLGRFDEAAEILLAHFEETVKAGSRPSACAFAGAYAIRMLCVQMKTDRARPVYETLLPMVAGLKPSPARVLVKTAGLELLATEGRRVHAAAAAEELLREIGEWDDPQPDLVRGALPACAAPLIGTARGIAIFSLLELTGPRVGKSLLDDSDMETHAAAWQEVTAADVAAAADQLFAEMPVAIERIGLSVAAFRDGAHRFGEGIERLSSSAPEERYLGRQGAAALVARAEAGCPLSAEILRVTRLNSGTEQDDSDRPGEDPPEDGRRAYDASIVRDHPRLRDALGHVLTEGTMAALPVLLDSLDGRREARLVWAGTMIDNGPTDPSPGAQAMMAVIRGDPASAWNLVRQQNELSMTVSACIAIEEFCLAKPDENRSARAVPDELVSFALLNWQRFLDQAAEHRPSALAAHLGLASAFYSARAAIAGLLEAESHGIRLTELAAIKEDEPVASSVFELLQDRPDAQLAIAEVAVVREPDQAEEALELLEILSSSEDQVLALRARVARLSGLVQQKREDQALEELEQAVEYSKAIEPGSPELIPALETIASVALALDRASTARAVARSLLSHPFLDASASLRHSVLTLNFRALVADGQWEAAAETLEEIGTRLGFSAACATLAVTPAALDPDRAPGFVDVLVPLARRRDPNRDLPRLRSARMSLLERIDNDKAWAPLRKAVAAPEPA